MPSPIQQLIQRKPGGAREIDVQLSLHLIAKELIALRDEERRVRNNRRFRKAVQAVFQANGGLPLTRAEVVRGAYDRLRVKKADATKVLDDLWNHVTLNRDNGYLKSFSIGVILK